MGMTATVNSGMALPKARRGWSSIRAGLRLMPAISASLPMQWRGKNKGWRHLFGAASSFPGGGFLLPTRNNELFRWCMQHGLRLVHQMTLMTIGLYNEPEGAYLPSVLY